MTYTLDLECPVCGRLHMQLVTKQSAMPAIYCLQCLKAERPEIEFRVVSVTVNMNGEDQ